MNDEMMNKDKKKGDMDMMDMMDDGRERTDMMDGGLYRQEQLSLENRNN